MAHYYLNPFGLHSPLFPGFMPTMPLNETLMLLPSEQDTSEKTLSVSASPSSESSPKMMKKDGPSSTAQRIKRPMNAFMVWSQIRRQEISSTGGKIHNSDISKMLGAQWRTMADDEKAPFVQKARELRDDHFREHPDYVYRPRRRKRNAKIASTESKNSSTDEPPLENNPMLPSMFFNQLIYSHILSQISQGPQIMPGFNLSPTAPIAPQNPLSL